MCFSEMMIKVRPNDNDFLMESHFRYNIWLKGGLPFY